MKYRKLFRVFLIPALIFLPLSVFSSRQNAPVLTIGKEITTGSVIQLEITAESFVNVRSGNHQILYDPAIANVLSFAQGPALAGTLSSNLSVPGQITFGWFTSPGFTLPEGEQVVFIISFEKISAGTSSVVFDPDYPHRNWVHGDYYQMPDLPFENFYIPGSVSFCENAPLTVINPRAVLPGSGFEVPVVVKNFFSTGSFSLELHFDPLAVQYLDFENSSGFPGLSVENPSDGKLIISAYSPSTGFFIEDDAVLCQLLFKHLSGNSFLAWYDDGLSCHYTGPPPEYEILNDQPFQEFYFNGNISEGGPLVLELFLQGLYNPAAGNMNKARDFNGNEYVDKYEGTIADMISVRLHDASDFQNIVFQLVDVALHQDGTAVCFVPPGGEFYISVSNRNHIRAVSSSAVEIDPLGTTYSFVTGPDQAFGDNLFEAETGVWCLFAGDANRDGVVDLSDREIINQGYLHTLRGYLPADINGDGIIDLADREMVNDAFLHSVSEQTP